MADANRLRQTEEWGQMSPEAQQQLETMYQQASPEEQAALVQRLTPQGLGRTAEVVSWFPGFEWMHALPPQTQQQVVRTVGETAEKAAEPGMEPMVGELIGSALPVGPWKPVTGAAGAALGEGVRQWRAGEPFSPGGMAKEAGLSALPEVAESALRWGGRQFLRNTPGGQRIRMSEAAERSRAMPERVFQPRPAEQISDAFEEVRRSGLNIDTQDITNHLTTLSPGKQADTLNLLTRLDTRNATGGRYAQLYQDLLSGQGMGGRSIGDLQTLRSDLRRHAAEMDPGEARQLVRDLQGSVDDAIDFGMTSGAMQASTPQIRETLHQARRDWAHRAAADDLGDLIEGKITSSPNLQDQALNLKGLADELRRGRSEASRSINRSLDLTPGGRERFHQEMQDLSRLYENIEMSMSDVAGIWRAPGAAALRQGMGQLLLTERGRMLFREAVTEGRGRLSPSVMASLLNEVRRQTVPEATGRARPEDRGVQSWFAPGGVARSTD